MLRELLNPYKFFSIFPSSLFTVYSDRYVLIGNHRDSWTFGALDPSSGTTSMIEVVRALGKIKKDKSMLLFLFP